VKKQNQQLPGRRVYVGALVPQTVADRLRSAAEAEDRSLAAVLRRIVAEYIRNKAA